MLTGILGCGEIVAQGNLDRLVERARGVLLAVAAKDFAGVDVASPAALRDATTSCLGSSILRDALIVDGGLRRLIAEHGAPDALILLDGRTLQLFFAPARQVIVVELRGASELSVVGARVLLDDERRFVDEDVRRRVAMAHLRSMVAALDRVWPVFVRVRGTMPGLPPSKPGIDVILLPASPASRAVFDVEDGVEGWIVGWVPPDTPAATRITRGDVLTAVDGQPVLPTTRSLPDPPDGATTVRCSVRRGGVTSEVTVPLEAHPPARLVVLHSEDTWAFAKDQTVYLSTAMVELTADDATLAALIGHELAHIAAGHTAAVSLPKLVTVPIELVLPGVGTAAVGALRRPFLRDQEREADRLGQRAAMLAGFDGNGMARLFEALEALEGSSDAGGFFSTHPSYPERIGSARANADRLGSKGE